METLMFIAACAGGVIVVSLALVVIALAVRVIYVIIDDIIDDMKFKAKRGKRGK